jgi:hypothetical protein
MGTWLPKSFTCQTTVDGVHQRCSKNKLQCRPSATSIALVWLFCRLARLIWTRDKDTEVSPVVYTRETIRQQENCPSLFWEANGWASRPSARRACRQPRIGWQNMEASLPMLVQESNRQTFDWGGFSRVLRFIDMLVRIPEFYLYDWGCVINVDMCSIVLLRQPSATGELIPSRSEKGVMIPRFRRSLSIEDLMKEDAKLPSSS